MRMDRVAQAARPSGPVPAADFFLTSHFRKNVDLVVKGGLP